MSESPQPVPSEPNAARPPPVWRTVSPALRAALFDPESWHESLEAYAHTTNLAVVLADAAGRQLGPCLNPRPTWQWLHAHHEVAAAAPEHTHHNGTRRRCPFVLVPDTPCTCVRDALARRELVLRRDRAGLVHFTVPLVLEDHPVGALLAGQVFDQYPAQLLLEHVATRLGLAPQAVWQVARLEQPVTQATLQVYGRLLATLGQAFLQARYHTLLEAQRLAALEQQRDLLAVTLRSIGEAVITTDAQGQITFLNPVAETVSGWPRQEALGQPFDTVFPLVHAHTRQPVASPVAQALQEGPIGDVAPPTVLRTRDGQERLIAASGALLQHEGAALHGVVVVVRDVSAQHRLDAQLRQAQRLDALGTLAGGLAHELNNLLAVILGYTELVDTTLALDSQAHAQLQQVLTATLRAKALLEQLLTFSRRTPIAPMPVSLIGPVRDMLTFLRTVLPDTLTLVHHLPVEPCLVLADATQLHEIVLQLGRNAVAAMRATGGQLDVRLEAIEVDAAGAAAHPALHPGPYVRLTLRDTGPGMPPEVLARICEPFFTTHGVGQGTGLGLAVVHGMVTYHGGALVVESTLGEGTTCRLYLPRLVVPLEGDGPSSALLP